MEVNNEVNPLSIIFVKSDSKGDRLLFRFPHTAEGRDAGCEPRSGERRNPYAVSINEDLLQNPLPQTSNVSKGHLAGFTDEVLSTLFAVKAELCNRKFELKVNDVRFVGHPTLLPYRSNKDDTASMILINIVFALQASASHSIVKCYYDLSKRLGKALRHEEKRCSYLSEEMKIMMAVADEVSALESERSCGELERDRERSDKGERETTRTPSASPFHHVMRRSSLARSLATVFKELSTTGLVQVRINRWVLVSFCLPHKAHQIHNTGLLIEPETIDKCLGKLKPYHGMLLMVDPNELLESMPLDGSAALLRLIKLYSPLKSLQTIALEADLQMAQVFQLTGHLVYWAKATIIYPLCASNVYVVAEGACANTSSPLVDAFSKEFPNLCLLQVLSMFSLPAPLWYHARCGAAGGGADGARLARLTAWLLRRRLLLQLHTYVQFNMSHWGCTDGGKEYYCEKHGGYSKAMTDSVSSLSQLQLNLPETIETRNGTMNFFGFPDDNYPTENHLNQTDFSHTKPIVIGSDQGSRYNSSDVDSANHSFDDGVDTVDGFIKRAKINVQTEDSDKIKNDAIETEKKLNGTSVDSGVANLNGEHPEEKRSANGLGQLEKKLSGNSLAESDTSKTSKESSLEGSNADGRSEHERSPRQKSSSSLLSGSSSEGNKNGISLNLKIQSEMSLQPPTVVWSAAGCDAGDSGPGKPPPADHAEESLLERFTDEERAAIFRVPAAHNPEDIALLAQLHKRGYFRGEHHLEEIMFYENLTRSQVMLLIDKFRDVLITFETEDPAVALLYTSH